MNGGFGLPTVEQMEREIAPLDPSWRTTSPRKLRGTSAEELVNVLVVLLRDRGVNLAESKKLIEDEYIRQVLFACKGNKCKASRTLGIHRNTLLRRYGK